MKNTDILQKFGSRIRELRKDKGLSQEQLAELTGFHRTYIGMIERGERNPALINIEIFSNAFDMTSSELLNLQGNKKMKLADVLPLLPNLYNKKFNELKLQKDISDFTINKGNTGQFLQRLLGMPNDSKLTDFEDGELKTNKSKSDGMPDETMFITQISKDFDSLFFQDTTVNNRLFTKISNLLYLPVVKEDKDPNQWYFLTARHIEVANNQALFTQLQQDFETIKAKVLDDLENAEDKFIHTSNGKYIQIRSKDAKRKNGEYNPIYSEKLGRYVSNKNHAFYFKKEFMMDIQKDVIDSKKII